MPLKRLQCLCPCQNVSKYGCKKKRHVISKFSKSGYLTNQNGLERKGSNLTPLPLVYGYKREFSYFSNRVLALDKKGQDPKTQALYLKISIPQIKRKIIIFDEKKETKIKICYKEIRPVIQKKYPKINQDT